MVGWGLSDFISGLGCLEVGLFVSERKKRNLLLFKEFPVLLPNVRERNPQAAALPLKYSPQICLV